MYRTDFFEIEDLRFLWHTARCAAVKMIPHSTCMRAYGGVDRSIIRGYFEDQSIPVREDPDRTSGEPGYPCAWEGEHSAIRAQDQVTLFHALI